MGQVALERGKQGRVVRSVRTVVFDLGGVLIDWDPRNLYVKFFGDDREGMERFLGEICTPDWNTAQDAGRTIAEAVAGLTARFPEQAALIEAYYARWTEMLNGSIDGSVDILRELRDQGTPLYALTNFSAETFPVAQRIYDYLAWFRGIVVSGHEGLIKPDPRIYRLLLERYELTAENVIYIDDVERNAQAANDLGMTGLHFTGPDGLRDDLTRLGVLNGLGVLNR